MKTKKVLIFSTFIAIPLLAAGAIIGTQSSFFKTYAADNSVWNHYEAVQANIDKKGSREYWVNCSSHEAVFEAPDSLNIVDKGAPTQQWVDSLSDSDPRLIKPTYQVISFENDTDASLIYSLRNGFASKTVVDDATPTDGQKALKLTWTSTNCEFMVNKDYLDKAFADPNVVAVNFDAKANTAYEGFVYVTNTTGAQGDVLMRYETRSEEGFGLTTEWKTFSWTRELYNNLVQYPIAYSNIKHAFFWRGVNIWETFELYLDNFRPVTTAHTPYGFEGGRLVSGATYPSFRRFDGTELVAVNVQNHASEPATYSFDYSIKSEGNRSLKVHKPQGRYLQIGFPALNNDGISETDVITVDVYATSAFNTHSSNKGVRDGNDNPIFNATSGAIDGNKWNRFELKKANFKGAWAINFAATTECDVYIDNIQVNPGNANGFEGNNLFLLGGHYYVRGASDKVGDNMLVQKSFNIQTNGAADSVTLTKTRHTEGTQSLRVNRNKPSGDMNVYLSTYVKNQLKANPDAYVTIDIFTTQSCTTMRNGRSTSSEPDFVRTMDPTTPYEWKTYTLKSDDLTGDGRALIIAGSSSVGEWYFDNIQFFGF